MKNPMLLATLTMVGTIVGAGIFGVPYVFAKAGIPIGLAHLVVLGAAVLLVHVLYAHVAAATPGKHGLVGYVRRHLGVKASWLAAASSTVSYVGALLAYLILGGSFLSILFGGTPLFWSLVFYCVMALIQGLPVRSMERLGSVFTAILIAVAAVIIVTVGRSAHLEFFTVVHPHEWFAPYGVILFAITGASVIPDVVGIMKGRPGRATTAVALGTLIAIVLTGAFGTVVALALGNATTENAIAGLVPVAGRAIISLGALFGLLAVSSTFISFANTLKEQFRFDFKLPQNTSLVLALGLPLVLYLAGIHSFIVVIGFLGSVSNVVFGGLILLMAWKLPRIRLHWLIPPLIVLFLLGIVAEIVNLAR